MVQSESIPLYLGFLVAAAAAADIGLHWDISWHRSIGRAAFWTPPHAMIYLCGALAAMACGYLIFAATYRRASFPKGIAVRMGSYRGPIGGFLALWGIGAMLTSAPFDNWWHINYGLDMKILSLPHVLLMLGILAVQTGGLLLVAAHVNRKESDRRKDLPAGQAPAHERVSKVWIAIYFYFGAAILTLLMVAIAQFTARSNMRGMLMYWVVALVAPAILAGLARAVERNWAATLIAAGYSAFCLIMLWILPLFPAAPGVGLVLTDVTHMIPLEFPLLLIAPAAALDLLFLKIKHLNKFVLSIITGVVFLSVFMYVQWEFAGFLQSPGARNWLFGAHYIDFSTSPFSDYAQHKFIGKGTLDPRFNFGVAIALACAVVSAWAGFVWGDWMRRLRR